MCDGGVGSFGSLWVRDGGVGRCNSLMFTGYIIPLPPAYLPRAVAEVTALLLLFVFPLCCLPPPVMPCFWMRLSSLTLSVIELHKAFSGTCVFVSTVDSENPPSLPACTGQQFTV